MSQRPAPAVEEIRAGPPPDVDLSASDGGPRSTPMSSVAIGAIAFLPTQPLTWAATLAATIVLPRYLGDHNLGQYTLVATVAGLVQAVSTLGLPSYLTRRVATRTADLPDHAAKALLLVILTATGIGVALSVALPNVGFPVTEPLLLPLALAAAVVGSAQGVVLAVLLGQERFFRTAWFGAVAPIVGPITGVAAVLAGGGVLAYVGVNLVVAALALFVSWYGAGLRFRRTDLEIRSWPQLIVGGSPFLIWNVAARIRSESDRILVALLATASAVGWYGAALRIVAIPLFVPTLITMPLLPALSRAAHDRLTFERTLRKAIVTVLLLTVPLSLMIVVVAPIIPVLLRWGPAFDQSVPLMVILALQQPILVVNMVLGTALIALKTERKWLLVGCAGALFSPLTNLALIPLSQNSVGNGAIGAALVTFGTETLMLSGALRLLPRGMLDRSVIRKILRVALAGLAALGVALMVRSVSMPLAVVAGGLTYSAAVGASGLIGVAELRYVGRLAWRSLPSRASPLP